MSCAANEFPAAVRAVCYEIAELLIAKNAAYGNSVFEPVRVFSKADMVEQIKVRIDDKISRLMRGNEAGEDVVLDMIGYLIILRIAQGASQPDHFAAPGKLVQSPTDK